MATRADKPPQRSKALEGEEFIGSDRPEGGRFKSNAGWDLDGERA